MERWAALVPSRSNLTPSGKPLRSGAALRLVGKLPETAWIGLLQVLPLPDVAAIASCSRALASLARDSRVWRYKVDRLAFKGLGAARQQTRADAGTPVETKPPAQTNGKLPSAKEEEDDGFGDFASGGTNDFGAFAQTGSGGKDDLMMLFDDEDDIGMNSVTPKERPRPAPTLIPPSPATGSPRDIFISHYSTLIPYFRSLRTHTTSSLVFTTTTLSPLDRAHLLSTLGRLLQPESCPTRSVQTVQNVRRNLQSACDFFEGAMLAEFEAADERRNEEAMRRVAEIAWELNGGASVVQVFVGKREIFYDSQNHDPLKNLTKVHGPTGEPVDGIDFSAMDSYMRFVLNVVRREGTTIARVFPPDADVLLDFADRIASDVISDYITTLLSAAQSLANPLFLLATAATFGQVYRLVDCIMSIEPRSPLITKSRAEDVVYRMFELHMDDYLSEEGEWTREVLEAVCRDWDQKLGSEGGTATFLASQNPAMVKRDVVAGFKKALLLPVTIVPKTMAYSLNAVTTGAFYAVSQIGAGIGLSHSTPGTSTPRSQSYTNGTSTPNTVDEEDGEEGQWSNGGRSSIDTAKSTVKKPDRFARLQLLLSLDTALQLIQADRDCLKRVQTFAGYPGAYGQKVRDAIEEVFLILLQTLSEKHIVPGFKRATVQMNEWQPSEHDHEGNVAPLVQFFELVHIGDTIGQMIQVFYEKEMASYIDRTDFLNVVVREKKRFEVALDDCVATGLNAGIQLLMGHVEHLVTSRQDPRDFAPSDEEDLSLQPTAACKAAVDTLVGHCQMMKGSTDKQILEVFYTEIGLRLHGIILKHLKRAIVSPAGGFQVIADLNAYHAFVVSLKQPSLVPYFAALKMVANLYIVESPKDLAGLVKDVQRYEGTLRGEDAYELLQRRTDWPKLQPATDKLLYGLSTEDCIVS